MGKHLLHIHTPSEHLKLFVSNLYTTNRTMNVLGEKKLLTAGTSEEPQA